MSGSPGAYVTTGALGGPRPLPGSAAGSVGALSRLVSVEAPSLAGGVIEEEEVPVTDVPPEVVPEPDAVVDVALRSLDGAEPPPATGALGSVGVVATDVVVGEAIVIEGAATLVPASVVVGLLEPEDVAGAAVVAVVLDSDDGAALDTGRLGASTVGGGGGGVGATTGVGAGAETVVVVVGLLIVVVVVAGGVLATVGAGAGSDELVVLVEGEVEVEVALVATAGTFGAGVTAIVGWATAGEAGAIVGAGGASVVTTGAWWSAPERPDAVVELADLVGPEVVDDEVPPTVYEFVTTGTGCWTTRWGVVMTRRVVVGVAAVVPVGAVAVAGATVRGAALAAGSFGTTGATYGARRGTDSVGNWATGILTVGSATAAAFGVTICARSAAAKVHRYGSVSAKMLSAANQNFWRRVPRPVTPNSA
jgi:hypothetical protein